MKWHDRIEVLLTIVSATFFTCVIVGWIWNALAH